jgi:hypothetical protein
MSQDPISRLQFARDEVDRVFGQGYAAAHPEVVASVMLSASLDWAAMHLAAAVRDVAAALVLEGGAGPDRAGDGTAASEFGDVPTRCRHGTKIPTVGEAYSERADTVPTWRKIHCRPARFLKIS